MDIRDAREADVSGILRIYNDAVANTTAIWNEQLSSLEQRVAWLGERRQSGFPVLVAAEGADVLGYASFGAFRPNRLLDGPLRQKDHSESFGGRFLPGDHKTSGSEYWSPGF